MGRDWSEAASGQVGRLLLRRARAVELAGEAAASGRPCVMLGSIIHNRDVVGSLARQGVTAVDRVEDVPRGCGVIIRSHGESRKTYRRLEERGAEILDATCPNVKRIHHIVARAEEQGRQPVIIGAPGPPGGGGHRRMVQPSGGPLGCGGPGEVAGGAAGAAGSSPHICLSNHLHTKNLE